MLRLRHPYLTKAGVGRGSNSHRKHRSVVTPTEPAPPARPGSAETTVARSLGRFRLHHLLGKSQRSMAWRVSDSQSTEAASCFLLLPREQPVDAGATERWQQGLRRAARLSHPNLAAPIEVGEFERWPYALYEATGLQTLSEGRSAEQMAAHDAAGMLGAALRGLAFAHEGGVAHRDLQPYMLLLGDQGVVRVMGLELASPPQPEPEEAGPRTSMEALALQAQRLAARHDVLCAGLLLHQVLSGRPVLDEPDIGALASRLPPLGRELVRLPWDLPLPVPEAVRAIANRSTDRQERQRYRSARGMLRALEGWLQAEGAGGGGQLSLLLDRLHSVGALPASPGSEARSARLGSMNRQRTFELAEVVLQDIGLSFELLRAVNSAQVRSAQLAGSGPVLTVRRAIAMLGIDGVRRAATGLRNWPGPLSQEAAQALRDLMDSAKRAGRVAQALRPAGYDPEAVHLICLLQNLGRLVTAYHFPDDWQQLRRLMQPAPAARTGEPDDPGMSEVAASYAVMGADIEAIGIAVARHWGLDDTVLHLIRRLPQATAPRGIDSDEDSLRAVASCGNEAVDASALPAPQREVALRRVALRYARALHIELRDLQDALKLPATTTLIDQPIGEIDDENKLVASQG